MAREMKDSGIEWIGEIPCDWNVQRIKTIFALRDERNNLPLEEVNLISLYTDKGVVQHSDLEKTTGNKASNADGYKMVYENDIIVNIILCWMGAIGRSSYKGVTSPAYDIYVPSNAIECRFYHHYFRTKGFSGDCYKRGKGIMAMRWRTYSDQFRDIKVLVPPLAEQKRIVSYLDTQCAHIDSVIEKTCAAIEEYKKLKQAVITQAVTKGIRLNREMKDSGIEWIGEVPSAFVCRKLKSLALLISKGATPKDISIELDNRHIVRFLKSENIVDNHLKEKPEFRITTDIHEGELKRSVLSENDILFVIAGASIGKTAVMEIGLLPANTNQAVSFIRIESKYCFAKKYIWYFLQSEVVKRFIFLFAVQSAQPNLSMENLGSIRMPFPKSKEEVLEIITYLDEKTAAIDSLIQKKEQLISELEAYKKSLIYEYVTGKKEVPVHAH